MMLLKLLNIMMLLKLLNILMLLKLKYLNFSLMECRDKSSKLPMMLPSAEEFANYIQAVAGIENHHHVIIYDNSERFGLFSAPRAWYIFTIMGHKKISILDGGLPAWVKEGYETASGEYATEEQYACKFLKHS